MRKGILILKTQNSCSDGVCEDICAKLRSIQPEIDRYDRKTAEWVKAGVEYMKGEEGPRPLPLKPVDLAADGDDTLAPALQAFLKYFSERTGLPAVFVEILPGEYNDRYLYCDDMYGTTLHCAALRTDPSYLGECLKSDWSGAREAVKREEPWCYACHRGNLEVAFPIFLSGEDSKRIFALVTGQMRVGRFGQKIEVDLPDWMYDVLPRNGLDPAVTKRSLHLCDMEFTYSFRDHLRFGIDNILGKAAEKDGWQLTCKSPDALHNYVESYLGTSPATEALSRLCRNGWMREIADRLPVPLVLAITGSNNGTEWNVQHFVGGKASTDLMVKNNIPSKSSSRCDATESRILAAYIGLNGSPVASPKLKELHLMPLSSSRISHFQYNPYETIVFKAQNTGKGSQEKRCYLEFNTYLNANDFLNKHGQAAKEMIAEISQLL
jgi:ligand-binding sensor protein